ncbi:hypothetical protein V493_02936 [Pseudogymnoascus sp. VKM F-4281 (FW-2241)]|nr:hypothetical protein V493_02936 [Pseudogymnoascus sp. VKM F-4281 (FW-2241)]
MQTLSTKLALIILSTLFGLISLDERPVGILYDPYLSVQPKPAAAAMPTPLIPEPAPMDIGINVALEEYCGIESAAFALAVIRPDGQISTFLSDDLKTDPKFLFTPEFQNELLMASGRQPLHHNMLNREFGAEGTELPNQIRSCRNRISYPSAYDDGYSTDSSMSLGSRKRFRTTTIHSRDRAAPTLLTRTIIIGDDEARDKFYRQCLTDIQTNGCKLIGKAWVKLLEPKKQSTYPYTKGAPTRPPWWPAVTGSNNIRHKEPDHLHMGAQQRKIDVAKLDEVTRKAMATWFENPKNAEKRSFLTQLFCVLYKEERYRRGELDGSTTVCVNDDSTTMCVNDGARPIDHEAADDEDEDSDISPQLHQAQPISPFLPTPPSSVSPLHPYTTTSPGYYHPRLPLPLPTPPDTTARDDYTNAVYPFQHYSTLTHNPACAWPHRK